MKTPAEFLESLGKVLRADDLSFDDDGQLIVTVSDSLIVFFKLINDEAIDMVAPLDVFPDLDDDNSLNLLLTANFLGAGTGSGRIAIDPVMQDVVLAERLVLDRLHAEDLPSRIEQFISRVVGWSSDQGRDLFVPPVPLTFSEMTFRI